MNQDDYILTRTRMRWRAVCRLFSGNSAGWITAIFLGIALIFSQWTISNLQETIRIQQEHILVLKTARTADQPINITHNRK